jgi:hypothetical protein
MSFLVGMILGLMLGASFGVLIAAVMLTARQRRGSFQTKLKSRFLLRYARLAYSAIETTLF